MDNGSNYLVGCVIQKRLKIPDDKSDPHSGSESCGSDDMSHQSSPNVSSSTILSAFTSHGKFFITNFNTLCLGILMN